MFGELIRRVGGHRLRLGAFVVIGLTWVGLGIALLVRDGAAGVDAYAYWTTTRAWGIGGDPYASPCPICYAYAPWGLPLLWPWATLPWPTAFVVWRGVTLAGLAASVAWAAQRRPVATAVLFAALSVPIGINLDTGNATLVLALILFGAQLLGARWSAVAWGIATGWKWVTAPLLLLVPARTRRLGLAVLFATLLLDLVLLPQTMEQIEQVLEMNRPVPWDYLVVLWAGVPWLWRLPVAAFLARVMRRLRPAAR